MDLCLFLIALAVILYGVVTYVKYRNNTTVLENEVRMKALELFLYAEKQDWIGEEKMKFAVDKIMKLVDDTILAKVIKGQTVEVWLQNFYDSVKQRLEAEIHE